MHTSLYVIYIPKKAKSCNATFIFDRFAHRLGRDLKNSRYSQSRSNKNTLDNSSISKFDSYHMPINFRVDGSWEGHAKHQATIQWANNIVLYMQKLSANQTGFYLYSMIYLNRALIFQLNLHVVLITQSNFNVPWIPLSTTNFIRKN